MRADASIGPYNKTKIAAVLFPGSRDFLSLIQFFPLLVGSDLDIHRPRQEAAQRHAGGYQRAGHNDRLAAV